MAILNGRYRIVFNGEIYNYRELRRELADYGHVFHSYSDTEVLLHLYSRFGREMLTRLRGMYAFALWDESARGLLLARDPLGIKPLYVADDGATVRISSQVKALVAGGIDTTTDPAGHVGFFLWGHVPEPYTLFRGIRSLPAGASMWIDAHGYTVRSSGVTDLLRRSPGSPANREITRGELREALLDSVRHHLVADVPVGLFLSSGIDSTTLAALSLQAGARDLRTITLGFREYEGTAQDETKLAEVIARHTGCVHRTCWIGRQDFVSDLPRITAAMDQPSVDGVNMYFISKVAAEAGLKVAMSGLGGDEMFGGYSGFSEIPRMVRLCFPARLLPGFGSVFRFVSARALRRMAPPKLAGLFEYGGTYEGAYLLRRSLFMPWELPQVLDPDLVRAGWRELATLANLNATIRDVRSAHARVSALELNWYMRNQLLRDGDWAGMAHSLEIRVPFVDITLLRTLAPAIAGANPPSKLDLAYTVAGLLPEELLARRKTGFAIPVREWLAEGTGTAGRGLRGWARYVYDSCWGKEAGQPTEGVNRECVSKA